MSASTYGFNGNNPFVSIYSVDTNGNLQSPAETRPVSLNGDGPFTVNCPAAFTNDATFNDSVTISGPTTCNGTLGCFGGVCCYNTLHVGLSATLDAGATCNNELVMASGNTIRFADSTNTFGNEIFSDHQTGGLMFDMQKGQNELPEPSGMGGMGILWDSDDGSGTTDLINYGQGGAGLGFNLRAVNANTPCVTVATFWNNKLPTFTYGPVCYGFIPASWSALVLPYFITGGFQIANTSTGVYTITYPNNLMNVTCQVSLGTVEGAYMMGCCVQSQTVEGHLAINTFQIVDANNTATKPESLPFNDSCA